MRGCRRVFGGEDRVASEAREAGKQALDLAGRHAAAGADDAGGRLAHGGERDLDGRELRISTPCPADEIAAAAGLVMAKASAVPVAIVRGYPWERGEGSAREIVRPADRDLFP